MWLLTFLVTLIFCVDVDVHTRVTDEGLTGTDKHATIEIESEVV